MARAEVDDYSGLLVLLFIAVIIIGFHPSWGPKQKTEANGDETLRVNQIYIHGHMKNWEETAFQDQGYGSLGGDHRGVQAQLPPLWGECEAPWQRREKVWHPELGEVIVKHGFADTQYAVEFLNGLDPDPEAQEMMLEQFVAEAHSGRKAMDFWHEGGGAVDLLSDLTEQAVAAPRHQAGGTRSSYGVTLERRAAPRAVWPAGPPVSADLLGFGHSLSADARAGAAKDSSDAPLTESRERCEWPLLHADDVQVGAAVAAVPAALPATALAALQSQNLGGGRLRSTLV